jgi:hypothetical protein
MTCAPHCNVKIHSSCCCIYLCLLHCDVHLYDNLIFASHGGNEAMFLKCDVGKCLSLCDVRKCLSQCNVRKCLSLCDVRKCLSQCDVRKCLSLCDVMFVTMQCFHNATLGNICHVAILLYEMLGNVCHNATLGNAMLIWLTFLTMLIR